MFWCLRPRLTFDSSPTAIGDHPFKQPPEFTRRILYNLEPTYADIAPWEAFLLRNLTPPYISNEAEVIHRRLGSAPVNGTTNGVCCSGAASQLDGDWKGRHFLVLCTDGLADLYDGIGVSQRDAAQAYVDSVVAALGRSRGSENLAKQVLWDALGGEDDSEAVSRMMTVESDEVWMDDTTVVVQLL
jgi:pyruvate dehydrogenase phosphatase